LEIFKTCIHIGGKFDGYQNLILDTKYSLSRELTTIMPSMGSLAPLFFLNEIFSYQTQIGNQPQEDVAKFGYKKNRRVEKLGVLLHFGDLLSKPCGFLGRDLEICQFFCNFIAS
jgi:hypothetical protein